MRRRASMCGNMPRLIALNDQIQAYETVDWAALPAGRSARRAATMAQPGSSEESGRSIAEGFPSTRNS